MIANRGEKHIWKIKINQTQNGNVIIGVSCQNDPQTNVDDYEFLNGQMGYGYCLFNGLKGTNGKYESYRSIWRSHVSGDVITVILDLQSEYGTLSFNDFGVAYDQLDINEQYRLAVSIDYHSVGTSVTILSHERSL